VLVVAALEGEHRQLLADVSSRGGVPYSNADSFGGHPYSVVMSDDDVQDHGFDDAGRLGGGQKFISRLRSSALFRLLQSFAAIEFGRSVAKPTVSRAAATGGDSGDRDAPPSSSWPAWPAVAAALRIAASDDVNVLALRTVRLDGSVRICVRSTIVSRGYLSSRFKSRL